MSKLLDRDNAPYEPEHDHADHGPSLLAYFGVFGFLMLFTGLTVIAAFFNLGMFNTPIALFIAVAKAVAVILIFMHVKYSSRLTKLTVMAGFFWLLIMIVLTMGDYLTRAIFHTGA